MTSGPPRPPGGGEVNTRTEVLTPAPAEALAGLLDIDPPPLADGAALPPLWHWVYLLERRRQSELGHDGHPTQGVPAPPQPGARRMFAGGRVTAYHRLRVGAATTRTSWVQSTVDKAGRSGPLTFVTVRTTIEQDGTLAILEEQDIVYRPADSAPTHRTNPQPAEPPAARSAAKEFDIDRVLLFRFSALTYNAHRIHYDRDYTAAEGYPDLVVHGPLQALLMGELLRYNGLSMLGRQFSYRLVAPVFGPQRLTVTADITGTGASAKVYSATGQVSAVATLQDVDVTPHPAAGTP